MTIKTKAYLENLKKFLNIDDLKELNENHYAKLGEYLELHQQSDVFRDLIKSLPSISPVLTSAIKMMNETYNNIISSGNYEIDSIKEIILSLNKLIEKENLSDNDKDKIFDLIKEYKITLDEQLTRNHELKKYIIGGGTLVTITLAVIVYKMVGGKGGEELITKAISKT